MYLYCIFNLQSNFIEELVDSEENIDLKLSISFRNVSIDLTLNESLIVINTLAVKRAEIRGGAWSTVGKQIEAPLMMTLCKLFNVPDDNIDKYDNITSFREVDFCILSNDNKRLRCEVKLLGKGNPESADAIFARESDLFVGDKLSNKNKEQAHYLNVEWIALRDEKGYKRFHQVLNSLNVPHENFDGDLDERLQEIFNELF